MLCHLLGVHCAPTQPIQTRVHPSPGSKKYCFRPTVIEPMNVKPMDTEGQLHIYWKKTLHVSEWIITAQTSVLQGSIAISAGFLSLATTQSDPKLGSLQPFCHLHLPHDTAYWFPSANHSRCLYHCGHCPSPDHHHLSPELLAVYPRPTPSDPAFPFPTDRAT